MIFSHQYIVLLSVDSWIFAEMYRYLEVLRFYYCFHCFLCPVQFYSIMSNNYTFSLIKILFLLFSQHITYSILIWVFQKFFYSYVPWNAHEPVKGKYDFKDQQNIVEFLKTAQKYNLTVILRPGPYICAEWEFVSTILEYLPLMLLHYL